MHPSGHITIAHGYDPAVLLKLATRAYTAFSIIP
jgi:hypothetical protein